MLVIDLIDLMGIRPKWWFEMIWPSWFNHHQIPMIQPHWFDHQSWDFFSHNDGGTIGCHGDVRKWPMCTNIFWEGAIKVNMMQQMGAKQAKHPFQKLYLAAVDTHTHTYIHTHRHIHTYLPTYLPTYVFDRICIHTIYWCYLFFDQSLATRHMNIWLRWTIPRVP